MGEIIMTEEEKYYTEITNKLDEFSDTDRAFILWYLLKDYGKFVGLDKEINKEPTNKSEYAIRQMALKQKAILEEMEMCLSYAIW